MIESALYVGIAILVVILFITSIQIAKMKASMQSKIHDGVNSELTKRGAEEQEYRKHEMERMDAVRNEERQIAEKKLEEILQNKDQSHQEEREILENKLVEMLKNKDIAHQEERKLLEKKLEEMLQNKDHSHQEERKLLENKLEEMLQNKDKAHQDEREILENKLVEVLQSKEETHKAEIEKIKQEMEEETKARIENTVKERLESSRSVLKGKIGEHMAPLLQEFCEKYNPSDARFMGAPVDYIIFKNMDDDSPIDISFVDVKTGKASLTKVQRRIQDAVNNHRVNFEVLRIEDVEKDTQNSDVQNSKINIPDTSSDVSNDTSDNADTSKHHKFDFSIHNTPKDTSHPDK